QRFDAALIDLNYARDTTSRQEGLELLAQLKRVDPDLPVAAMTAWGTIDIAVQARRAGDGVFSEYAWDKRRLASVIRSQVELGQARRNQARLATENALLRQGEDAGAEEDFIAQSPAMRPVMEMLRRVAPS